MHFVAVMICGSGVGMTRVWCFLAFEFGQNFKGRVNKAKVPSRDPPLSQSLAATAFQQCPSSATYRRAVLLLVLASSYQFTEGVKF
jgi:hypothetical protein